METIKQSGHGGRVDVRFDGPVAIVTIRRGENRINPEFQEQLHKALDEVESNPEAQVLITTGDGKFYCNGMDVEWISQAIKKNADEVYAWAINGKLMDRILTFPMPTIAAVNGHCFAGGAIVAMSHDYIIMQSGKGWFCVNEVFLNMRFTPKNRATLRAKLTPSQISEMAVLGKRFKAEEAKNCGFIKLVAPPGAVIETAVKFASGFISQPVPYSRDALHNMKCDIYADVLNTKAEVNTTLFKARI